MNKRMMKQARKLVIDTGRLNDNREQYPVEWLLKDIRGSGYFSRLDMIKGAILCMNKEHPNYENLSPEEKQKVETLIAHPEIVDMVITTVFQWFGTNVGKHDVGDLLDEIRKLGYKREV